MAVGLGLRLGDEEKRKRADEKTEAVHQEKSGKIKQKGAGVKRQCQALDGRKRKTFSSERVATLVDVAAGQHGSARGWAIGVQG